MHAASYLVVYVPADKTAFIADHLGTPYRTGTPVANLNTVTLLSALQALDIDIKTIVTAHNGRVFNFRDLTDSVAAYSKFSCGNDRPVCT